SSIFFFFSSRRRHTRFSRDWSSDVCSSDLGDGIPYYSARATMGTFETLQPWFVDSWRRQKERCQETLTALYATDPAAVLDYAQRSEERRVGKEGGAGREAYHRTTKRRECAQ